MPRWLFLLSRIQQRLWLTVALYSVAGVITALVSAELGRYVPGDFPLKLGSEAVGDILAILASSMLAVATFSLTTLVTAYTSVIGNVTPHAAKLLVSDGAIRTSLGTFIGAFIFSVVGIIALHTGYYGAQGRVILFFTTLVVLVLIVLAMLRWIGELSTIAQTDDVIDRVAAAAAAALRTPVVVDGWRERPYQPPDEAVAVTSDKVGFVQNIDLEGLEHVAKELGGVVYLEATPGVFVHPEQPLLRVTGPQLLTNEFTARLRAKITIGVRRTFEQDPRYGFTVLGEIAGRALSPGVNDPGTARDVLSTTLRLLHDWVQEMNREGHKQAPSHLRIRPLDTSELIEDALGPIARDGAGQLPLQLELQTALCALAAGGDPATAEAARRHSRLALELSTAALQTDADRRRVAERAAHVEEQRR